MAVAPTAEYPGPSPAAKTWTYNYGQGAGMLLSVDTFDHTGFDSLVWHKGGIFYLDPYGHWQDLHVYFDLEDEAAQPWYAPGSSQAVNILMGQLLQQGYATMEALLQAFAPYSATRMQNFVPAQAAAYIAVAQGAAARQAFAQAVYDDVTPGADSLSIVVK